MAKIEIELPDRINSEITRLVEQGEFVNQDQAIEELLSLGASTYNTSESSDEEPYEEWEMQTAEDQQDPSLQNDSTDDERTL